jgi:hypothetical protein
MVLDQSRIFFCSTKWMIGEKYKTFGCLNGEHVEGRGGEVDNEKR